MKLRARILAPDGTALCEWVDAEPVEDGTTWSEGWQLLLGDLMDATIGERRSRESMPNPRECMVELETAPDVEPLELVPRTWSTVDGQSGPIL